MLDHWRYCVTHNKPLLPLYAIVHRAASVQPEGYICGWSINHNSSRLKAKSMPGALSIVEFKPDLYKSLLASSLFTEKSVRARAAIEMKRTGMTAEQLLTQKNVEEETSASNTTELKALVDIITRARAAYYNDDTGQYLVVKRNEVPAVLQLVFKKLGDGKGTVTDAVYDELESRLRAISPNHSLLKTTGAPPSKKLKIKLPFHMAGLSEIRGDAVDRWLADNQGPYVVSDKIDGVSIGVVYNGKRLAFTRGNGSEGGDISFMAKDLGLPYLRAYKFKTRGEIVMPVDKFNRLFKEHYKNPRAMVSGITNKNSLHEGLSHCHVYMYELVSPRMAPSAGLAKLKQLGFRVVPFKTFKTLDSVKLQKILETRRAAVPYEMDGLVVALDKKTAESTAEPKHTVKYKDTTAFAGATVTVVEVQWDVTRTGALFPRVMIKPVQLGGVTVTYCSGKSARRIENLGIGAGAKLSIVRAGDVIPDIVSVVKAVKPQLPNPKQFGKWVWKGDHVFLTNPKSNADAANSIKVQRLAFFFTTIGVERFRVATVQKFVDAGHTSVAKILKLTHSQFVSVEGGSVVLEKVWTQLQTALTSTPMHIVMYASGIFGRNFGSRRLLAIMAGLPNVLALKPDHKLVDLIDALEGFDAVTSEQFVKHLPAFNNWLQTCPSLKPVTKAKTVKVAGNRLKNQFILFTGFRDANLSKEIEKQSGTVVESLTKATILLAADPNSTSSKVVGARAKGITVMTPTAFSKKYLN